MLRRLKKSAKPIFWVIIIAFVGTIFFSWGMQYSGQSTNSHLAVVNGEPISSTALETTLQQFLEKYKKRYGHEFDSSQVNILRLNILNNLIRKKIIIKEAKKLNLMTTETEVLAGIKQTFDSAEVYNTYIKYAPRYWWNQKEQEVKEDILLEKMTDIVTAHVRITSSELNSIYLNEFKEADVSHILIKPERFVPAEDVKNYYKENIEEFTTLIKIKARHILLPLKKDATTEENTGTKVKAQELINQIKAGVDFAQLAKDFSACSSKEKGGDLGWFGTGSMVPEFEKAAFALKSGELCLEPVKTEFGYHIIRVDDRKEEEIKPLEKVGDDIRCKLMGPTEDKKAKKKAEKALCEITSGTITFTEAARIYSHAPTAKMDGSLGIIPRRFILTKTFNKDHLKLLKGEITYGVQIDPTFSKAVFSLKPDKISKEVVRTPFGYHIIKLHSKFPPSVQKLEENRDEISNICLLIKRDKVYNDWYKNLEKASKITRSSMLISMEKELLPEGKTR